MTDQGRRQEVEDHFNFRSLAEVRLSRGGVWGQPTLFRSGAPNATNVHLFRDLIETHDIRTVIDLRTTAERAAVPYAEGFAAPVHCLHLPLFETIQPHWENPKDQTPEATAGRYYEMLVAALPALGKLLQVVTDRHRLPCLVHCAKGRDRTGLAVSALLEVVGADRPSVADDYARFTTPDPTDPRPNRQTMVELLRLVDQHHGSYRNLLLEAISAEGLERARESMRAG